MGGVGYCRTAGYAVRCTGASTERLCEASVRVFPTIERKTWKRHIGHQQDGPNGLMVKALTVRDGVERDRKGPVRGDISAATRGSGNRDGGDAPLRQSGSEIRGTWWLEDR